jgi:glutathione S-transferase
MNRSVDMDVGGAITTFGGLMKLYYFPGACSLADHIALEWVGAPYEAVRMRHADTKSPQYLALNPSGTVPLLVDGGFVLSQNLAILYYLAESYPEAQLFGDGTLQGRADVLRWVALLNSDVHPAFKPIFSPSRFHPDASLSVTIGATARSNLREYFEQLDSRLNGRKYLTDARSIADPYLLVLLRWALKLGVDMQGFHQLAGFHARMYDDEGVRRALIAEEDRVDDVRMPS